MIHSVRVYDGRILKDDAQYIRGQYYVLIHVTTLDEAKTLAESLE